MWNNSSVGKFVNNYVVPVVKVGANVATFCGTGVIATGLVTAGKVVSEYEKVKDIPSYVKGKILDNPLTNKFTGFVSNTY